MPSFGSSSKKERLKTTLPFAATSYVFVSVHPFVLRAFHLPSIFANRAKSVLASFGVTARSAALEVPARISQMMKAITVRMSRLLRTVGDGERTKGCVDRREACESIRES